MMRVFTILIVAVASSTTEVEQCGREERGPLPIHTYVEGCTTPPCELQQQTEAVVNIVFTAPRTMRRMKTKVAAFINVLIVVEQDYPLEENEDTCQFLTNSYCPVVEGEVLQYVLRMPILPIFPTIRATLEFYVMDENDLPVFCIRIPIRVISADSKASLEAGTSYNATVIEGATIEIQ